MSSAATDRFGGIEQFEAGAWKIADDLRANSGLASPYPRFTLRSIARLANISIMSSAVLRSEPVN